MNRLLVVLLLALSNTSERGEFIVVEVTIFFFFQAEDGIRDGHVTGVQTCALPIYAAWLGSTIFDGARAFEGVTPDLDRHCARVNESAVKFGLKPIVDLDTWLGLAHEGIARFPANAELYVRPMYWPQNGIGGGVLFDPETTEWCL